ncbi:DedA family protein [Paraliobacillus salinarum]|uniref:DedA family protein n=1 Tax=Paraliobacillus salinarum TaxID=1158996 RepID=UPI0015F67C6F|nr:DedA family protein [Paraliobacillus salinarum]
MQDWLLEIINSYGYIGIVFLIAVENIFPPIPSEVILTFGGFLTTTTSLSIIGVIVASTLGSVFGAVVLYLIGASISTTSLKRFIAKRGHYLRLEQNDVDRAILWFNKYGGWSVFICRFIPLIRSLISVPAGLAKMRFFPFLLLTMIGTLIWNTVLVGLGAYVGESWNEIVTYMNTYSNILYAVLGLAFIVVLGVYFYKRK